MNAVSECAVAVARRIMAAGALTIGVAAVPSRRGGTGASGLPADARSTRHEVIPVAAFLDDLANALHALTSVPSTTWSARALALPPNESPLRDLVRHVTEATDYLLCDLAGLSERGEHGAAASALHAVIVLAPTGCDDRDLTAYLHELPRERVLGVVLTS